MAGRGRPRKIKPQASEDFNEEANVELTDSHGGKKHVEQDAYKEKE